MVVVYESREIDLLVSWRIIVVVVRLITTIIIIL